MSHGLFRLHGPIQTLSLLLHARCVVYCAIDVVCIPVLYLNQYLHFFPTVYSRNDVNVEAVEYEMFLTLTPTNNDSVFAVAGKPMKLIYFVSPYDLLDKKSLSAHPMTVEGKAGILFL